MGGRELACILSTSLRFFINARSGQPFRQHAIQICKACKLLTEEGEEKVGTSDLTDTQIQQALKDYYQLRGRGINENEVNYGRAIWLNKKSAIDKRKAEIVAQKKRQSEEQAAAQRKKRKTNDSRMAKAADDQAYDLSFLKHVPLKPGALVHCSNQNWNMQRFESEEDD